MLKCIKASITPVNCELKNPLKTRKCYDIIHNAEKQLLYERIRNFNNTLDMLEQNSSQYYSHLKSMINQLDQDLDIRKCIQFINKIKEHRHSKIKGKHIDKFDHIYFKRFGYHHNFIRNYQNFNNINHNCTLSGQSNVPSSISMVSSTTSSTPTVPTTPMASTPSASMDPASSAATTAPSHPPSSSRHTCKVGTHTKKWVINHPNPLTPGQLSLLQKGPNYAITPKCPPRKLTQQQWKWLPRIFHPVRQMNIRCQLLTQTTQHPAQQTQQPKPNTMKGTHTTQTGHIQGGTHSR